jgi:hypothetical protein
MNGLSDHDTQLITLKTISLKPPTKHFKVIRIFNENSLNDFLNKLSYEMWDITYPEKERLDYLRNKNILQSQA